MTPSNVSLDDTPDATTTGRVMAAHANVGRLSESGRSLTEPNWGNSLTFQVNNNLRELLDVGSQSVAGVNAGSCTVTGRLTVYFGDMSLFTKLIDNTPTSLSSRWQKDSQACIFTFPRITFRGGEPQVTGTNTDVTMPLDFQAALDTVTNSEVMIDRVPYYE
jgi:Phage tail tube protein